MSRNHRTLIVDKPDISVVVPVFKSTETLKPLYMGIQKVMDSLNKSFEVIFVEDSGSEESWKALLQLKTAFPDTIQIIKLTRNFGQNGATVCGIDESRGTLVITIDDDLQTHPREITKLIECFEKTGADVIYGQYKPSGSRIRNLGSKVIKKVFNSSQGGTSLGSSFRLITQPIVQRLKYHSQDHLFINQIINWYTINYGFVPVESTPRPEGSSGYSIWKLIVISFNLIFYYTNLPLKLTIYVCIAAVIGCAYFAWHFWKIITPIDTEIEVTTIVLFMGLFLILSSICVLAIYINRIYNARVKKPIYAIKAKI
ncbi:MAG: glycosyltransferase involved in cell wall biosynthesis [Flavobacteriales bacterium]|jgi:glycosyltransferase involved in cell wall biosynthesis